jgi:hypothetical protein
MPDYQNGKIYKLWSPQGNEIYIGSTTQPLYKRLYSHKSHHKDYNTCSSKYLFENYDNVKIELIQEYPCNNKMELAKKEGQFIRENNECLNRRIAGRTPKEYNEDNKEDVKEYKKEYRENNKEYIKEYAKEWYEKVAKQRRNEKFNCECGSVIRIGDKASHLKTKKHIAFMNSNQ